MSGVVLGAVAAAVIVVPQSSYTTSKAVDRCQIVNNHLTFISQGEPGLQTTGPIGPQGQPGSPGDPGPPVSPKSKLK